MSKLYRTYKTCKNKVQKLKDNKIVVSEKAKQTAYIQH